MLLGEDTDQSDDDADDEGGSESEIEVDRNCGGRRQTMGCWVREEIETMYAHRYEVPRDQLPRGPAYLIHVLTVHKNLRPDHFCQELRVSPATFDKIMIKI